MPTRLPGGATIAVALALAAGAPAPAAAAPVTRLGGTELTAARDLLIARCETQLIDVGTLPARWALLGGFQPGESDRAGRTFAWTAREFALRIIVTGEGPRRLTVRARSGPQDGQTLRALWNGVDLGELPVPRHWSEITWEVPAAAVRLGRNVLHFATSKTVILPADDRRVGVCLSLVRSTRDGAVCEASEVRLGTGGPIVLPEEAALTLVHDLPPVARIEFELSGAPDARADVVVSAGGWSRAVGTVRAAGGAQTVPIGGCGERAEVAILRRGTGDLKITAARLAGDESALRWRRCCGAAWLYPLLALTVVGLALACRRYGPRLPWPRAAPWLDAALVFALAAAVRWLFLREYPTMDWRRFGDAWEYLMRARILMRGEVSLVGDTIWHTWATWIRPPGYYLFLAEAMQRLGGLAGVARAQLLMTSAAAAGVQLMAFPLFGRRAALLAGVLAAFYAESVLSVVWILTEPLYLFLLVPALAFVAWTSKRPSIPLAVAAGGLLGLAALVRSAPVLFVPGAAVLIVVGHGWRRALRPAAALVVTFVLVIAPWCVRNSLLLGGPVLVDNLAIPNFLFSHPDDRYIKHDDLDLESETGGREYWQRVKAANEGGRLMRRGGARIILGGLGRMVREPVATVRHAGGTLVDYLRPFPQSYVQVYLGERRPCRIVFWTDAINLGYLSCLVLGLAGAALSLRDRRTWPLLFWFVFNTAVVVTLFFPSFMPGRFRLGSMPVLMAFAGVALERLLWRRRESSAAAPEPPG